jgi:hypothetical protein
MNWKFYKKIVGAIFIMLGLLAFLTPLTPGSWLVFVGAELLGIEMLSQRRVTEQYQRFKYWLRTRVKKEDTSNDRHSS